MKRTLVIEGKVFQLVPSPGNEKWLVLYEGNPIGIVQRVAGTYEAFVPKGSGPVTEDTRTLLRLVRDAMQGPRRFSDTTDDIPKPSAKRN
jgi:hypothetical protein